MKRSTAFLLVIIFAFLMLSACENGGGVSEQPGESPGAESSASGEQADAATYLAPSLSHSSLIQLDQLPFLKIDGENVSYGLADGTWMDYYRLSEITDENDPDASWVRAFPVENGLISGIEKIWRIEFIAKGLTGRNDPIYDNLLVLSQDRVYYYLARNGESNDRLDDYYYLTARYALSDGGRINAAGYSIDDRVVMTGTVSRLNHASESAEPFDVFERFGDLENLRKNGDELEYLTDSGYESFGKLVSVAPGELQEDYSTIIRSAWKTELGDDCGTEIYLTRGIFGEFALDIRARVKTGTQASQIRRLLLKYYAATEE